MKINPSIRRSKTSSLSCDSGAGEGWGGGNLISKIINRKKQKSPPLPAPLLHFMEERESEALGFTRNAKNRVRSVAGFTMVEIAICLAVIGFALVAIIGVLPIGMNVQKDNREETIINFDANYLMNAIRNGSLGQDELTNYVVIITNISQQYITSVNGYTPSGNPVTSWWVNNNVSSTAVNNSLSNPFGIVNGTPLTTNFLVSGSNIVGLLTTPKYTDAGGGAFYSNYVTADIRAITGSPVDHGISQGSRDFAFTYRLYPEVTPFGTPDQFVNAAPPTGVLFARNFQNNFHEIRLRFRWPVLPSGAVATGTQVYRTSASGAVAPVANGYFFRAQQYTNGVPNPISIP